MSQHVEEQCIICGVLTRTLGCYILLRHEYIINALGLINRHMKYASSTYAYLTSSKVCFCKATNNWRPSHHDNSTLFDIISILSMTHSKNDSIVIILHKAQVTFLSFIHGKLMEWLTSHTQRSTGHVYGIYFTKTRTLKIKTTTKSKHAMWDCYWTQVYDHSQTHNSLKVCSVASVSSAHISTWLLLIMFRGVRWHGGRCR